MNHQIKPSTAATNEQIAQALQVLFNSMRFPPGVDPEKAISGYMASLNGFPVEAIVRGIQRFLRGECEGVNPRYCPHPPELAAIVRQTVGMGRDREAAGQAYRYSAPKSPILEKRCTRDWARQLVDQGVHPRGSIWCPGSAGDKPEIGDLYGPDENWQPATRVGGDA